MTIASEKPRLTYAPSIGKRLAWWFGIYFVMGFWLFPIGLCSYIDPLLPHPDGTEPSADLSVGIAYGFYLLHLIVSLAIPSKRIFCILMIILVVAVTMTLSSCATEMHDL
jgi:hypothetical protein